jgi:ParB-like chromosome segregation protein Spo0J
MEGTAEMDFHSFAGIYPLLADDELEKLADDIRQNGLHEPIVTFEDKILDGRNRQTACMLAGVKPVYRAFGGDKSEALRFVRSENERRRHLEKGQRAACQVKFEKTEATIAAEVETIREAAKERKGGRPKADAKPPQTIGEVSKHDGETATARAKMAGTNRQYIHDADTLAEKAPDLLDAVAEGKKSIPQAKAELKERETPKPSTAGAVSLRAEDKKKALLAYGKLSQALENLRLRRKCDGALRTIHGEIERV